MILNHVTAHTQVEQVLTLVAMWWDLEDIPLRAICQTQKFCMYHSYDYCYSLAWVVKLIIRQIKASKVGCYSQLFKAAETIRLASQ